MDERLRISDTDQSKRAHGVEEDERLGAGRRKPGLEIVGIELFSQTKIEQRVSRSGVVEALNYLCTSSGVNMVSLDIEIIRCAMNRKDIREPSKCLEPNAKSALCTRVIAFG